MIRAGEYPEGNSNNDEAVPNPPTDGISSLCWSPTANFLASSSWDSKVRVYEVVNPKGGSKFTMEHTHGAPVLCSAWVDDGAKILFGTTDKKGMLWDLPSNQVKQVAQHDAPIKEIFWIKEHQLLVTGGWDKTIRYWDPRGPKEVAAVRLDERVYCMDLKKSFIFAGLANKTIVSINIRSNPAAIYQVQESPLKLQLRAISAFAMDGDPTGYAVGSIEGRVGIHHIDLDPKNPKNFAFRCHRITDGGGPSNVYAVNSIDFHPKMGTFATAGADGTFCYWDKENKRKLKSFAQCQAPITCCRFSTQGDLFAYSVSYDWSKGAEFYQQFQSKNKNFIFVRPVVENDVKPRKN